MEVRENVQMTDETWLICGGRDFTHVELFEKTMNNLTSEYGMPSRIVHGAAQGADTLADEWSRRHNLEVIRCPADWALHGQAAGMYRNEDMLIKHRPDRVIAFPGGRGTADMVWRAKGRHINTIEVEIK